MGDNIKVFPGQKVDPNVIIEKAKSWGLTEVVVMGWDANGEFHIGGSDGSLQNISWLLRNAEYWLNDQMTAGE